jgi:hypothetical protein
MPLAAYAPVRPEQLRLKVPMQQVCGSKLHTASQDNVVTRVYFITGYDSTSQLNVSRGTTSLIG